jgi:hypothetical protein
VCTEHARQVPMRVQSAVPSKHAEHTHRGTDVCNEGVRQELMHVLSVRVRNQRWAALFFSGVRFR